MAASKIYKQPTADYKRAFKDADIRGVYPTELDEDIVKKIGKAFVTNFGLDELIVGRDMRASSPKLRDAFVEGVINAGCDVIDIGLVDSPGLYFASSAMNLFGVKYTVIHCDTL